MAEIFGLLLLCAVLLIAVPVLVLCTETTAAFFWQSRGISAQVSRDRPQVAVLVPAHNESAGLAQTLNNIKAQLVESDRLVVVADNCSDNTAEVAASFGAEVIERMDPVKLGKGFALEHGVRYLAVQPPEVLIIIDADCTFSDGSLAALATAAAQEGRPVQALNLMRAPPESPRGFELAEFAWRVKNWVRPLGVRALGLPCQLTGTGMAFPWEVIRLATLATSNIVEDIKLGLELASKGKAARFCPEASVVSYFPVSLQGIVSQRERWQGGHLSMIAIEAPHILLQGLRKFDLDLIWLALDLSVPPLFLLAAVEGLLLALSSTAFLVGGGGESFWIAVTSNALFTVALIGCWFKFGRDIVPARLLLKTPLIAARRLIFYQRMIFGRAVPLNWIRTDRTK